MKKQKSANKNVKCKHVWELTSFWDGVDIKTGAPTGGRGAKCTLCRKEKFFEHQEWNKLSKKSY